MTTPTPRFEPRQLRDWAANRECCEGLSAETVAYERLAHAVALEDLAAAQENLQSADEDRLRMRAQTARLDAALIEKDISIAAREAELAERKEGFARMEFAIQQLEQQCNEARTRAESAERERDEARRDERGLPCAVMVGHIHFSTGTKTHLVVDAIDRQRQYAAENSTIAAKGEA